MTRPGRRLVVWHEEIPTQGGRCFAADRRRLRLRALRAHGGTTLADHDISLTCAHCGDPRHGKPAVSGLQFNCSSAGSTALVALGDEVCGIDVAHTARLEAMDPKAADRATRGGVSAACRTFPEVADSQTSWVVYEALAKGLGLGVAATGQQISEAAGWWAGLYQPSPGTLACLASASAPCGVDAAEIDPRSGRVIHRSVEFLAVSEPCRG